MARAKAYIETSVIGYLTARPSRDLIVAACQRATQEWWARHARRFDLYASILVIREAAKGTRSEARKRLAILEPIPLLDLNEAAFKLAERFIRRKVLPTKAGDDALHIALATVHDMDYLLTWNCKHIANPALQKKIAALSRERGHELPTICTPHEFLGV
ncbi:MAG TPA: type II toxin-antitoxin system VapC family toxin [Gemmataceae bacterium]|nr:type II toxin-antitoxin system VapC family toxin [Gemmataceae bacterium]